MDNSELERKLKAARGPALEPDYVEDFPRMVLANLNSARRETIQARPSWQPRLAWALATAVCIMTAFAAGHWHGRMSACRDVLASSTVIDEALAMFPNRVRAIVQDERGLNLILSDQADVPASTPIYVRICDGKQCSSLVTFSGQEIQLAGRKITVLSDLKIEARNLPALSM
jgi:hypothetical protein